MADRRKARSYYMHTIDGKPGTFSDGQVCFATHFGAPNELRSSLAEIRAEQRKSHQNREKWGFDNDSELGYVRVCLPLEATK